MLNRNQSLKTVNNKIKTFAKSLGVDLIGFAPAKVCSEEKNRLQNFIEEGRHGSMSYLEDYKKRNVNLQSFCLLKSP